MINRTPKNFDGIEPPGVKIAEVLPTLLAAIEKKAAIPFEAISREWFFCLGEKMAGFTRPISFADGVLMVLVKGSTLYSVLRVHEKPRLLKQLQEKFQVKDIVFKIG